MRNIGWSSSSGPVRRTWMGESSCWLLAARCEKPVLGKNLLQARHDRPAQLDLQVRPVAERGIKPEIFAPEIHPADERDAVVDHLQLAVIAQVEEVAAVARIERVAPRELAAGFDEPPKVALRQPQAAEFVQQQSHPHATAGRRDEQVEEFRADLVVAPDE
jgi:hypothetical protein